MSVQNMILSVSRPAGRELYETYISGNIKSAILLPMMGRMALFYSVTVMQRASRRRRAMTVSST